MKIIIVSDIKGSSESIIPYGLNLGKYLETEVEVVHAVDARVQQGVSSMVGDSQSITPGTKMDHAEIIQKEIESAEMAIDKILSKEASRLNYPLKIKVDVEEESIENKLQAIVDKEPFPLFLISQEADEFHFESQQELADIVRRMGGVTLFVPPKATFEPFSNVLLLNGFDVEELEQYKPVFRLLRKIDPVINVVGEEESSKEEHLKEWKTAMIERYPDLTVNFQLFASDDFETEFPEYASMVEPDMTIIFDRPRGLIERAFKKDFIVKILEQLDTVVLFYSNKSV